MCPSRAHKRIHIKHCILSMECLLWSLVEIPLFPTTVISSLPWLFNLHILVGRNISLGILQGFHSLPECDHWELRCSKGQKDMIYLLGVPRPKGILLSLVEILVRSQFAHCNKVPNTKMVSQVRPHPDCRERKCSFWSARNGDFPPAAKSKPSSFPLQYHVAKSYEICLLSCPSRSFLGLTNFQVLNSLRISVFLINFHSCVSFSKWNLGILRLV